MSHLVEDFKPGPLDVYRKKTSFDCKKLKLFIETEDGIKFQNEIYKILENNPLYNQQNVAGLSRDNQRRIAFLGCRDQSQQYAFSFDYLMQNLRRPSALVRILTTAIPSSYAKYLVANRFFVNSILSMGTERHHKIIDDAKTGKILGCYCLTEIAHGSNTKSMRTIATYDKHKKVFIINSPDFESAKCWAGGLGQTAMYGTVFAQLILDGVNYGLHAFLVPLRDPKTLIPYPGLEIWDMGRKIGLNGADNGVVQFTNYEIPRINLLNKIADVSEDGRYITPIKDPNRRHGAALGSLSAGRVTVATIVDALAAKAITIAVRYAAVRKQFGPSGKEEIPILEYQSQQLRLIPYLAATYVIRNFNTYFTQMLYEFTKNPSLPNALEVGIEIHGVSSASKPIAGWILRDAVQECRECCGGHGYLQAAGLGDVRDNLDPNLTVEGENHVLIQQTVKWLLKLAPQMLARRQISSPMHSIDFLSNGLSILSNNRCDAREVEEISHPESIITTFQWIVVYLLKATYEKVEGELKAGKDLFEAKNNSQVYYGKSLGLAFIQHFFLQIFLVTISEAEDPAIKAVLTRIFSLFGLWSIERWHMATLFKGGFASTELAPTLIQDAILKLCADLKDDAVGLVDAIAVPDFILRSCLGSSDGQVYKRLKESMTKDKYNMNRPPWWKEVVNYAENNRSKSKL
ncbi:peroxisomal acyl-coenzyme A oxidase 3-like [Diabrotica virgifera virgifera]|uniref:Acyl-coenzyme A oxidase n=1 Tax=Diabrotica virgifera virgifera TaxID=50390 RepID=A0ABM5IIF4_DIAVI|nr:peroxisomal acyl-coenzyme A oxidase 3-like [Diabrotica virgifera virgifera]